MPAPQATLMSTIIKGILAQDLPWGLVFVGMFIAVVIELCGVKSLSFAVGAYLPLSTTAPIFVGGMMRALVDHISKTKEESEVSSGMLYSTGLVAGGSLTGIAIALLSSISIGNRSLIEVLNVGHGLEHLGPLADLIGLAAFAVLCWLLVRTALKKLEIPA